MKKAGVGGTGFFPHRREPEMQNSSVGETDDYTYSRLNITLIVSTNIHSYFQIALILGQFVCQKLSIIVITPYHIIIIDIMAIRAYTR